MYQSWLQDQEDKLEFAKSHGILIGSFTNYEAAKKMLDSNNPKAFSTDEEFEQATQKVIEDREKYLSQNSQQTQQENITKRRRKKVINKNNE